MKPAIAYFESHNATIAVYDFDNDNLIILDLEKFSGKKHYQMFRPKVSTEYEKGTKKYHREKTRQSENFKYTEAFERNNAVVRKALHCLETEFGIKNEFSYFFNRLFGTVSFWDPNIVNASEYMEIDWNNILYPSKIRYDDLTKSCRHHIIHSYSTFGQSNFKEALCLSWDGMGDNSAFATVGMRENGEVEFFDEYIWSFSAVYNVVSRRIQETNSHFLIDGAGKVMGLSAYGKENEKTEKWMECLKKCSYYDSPEEPPTTARILTRNATKNAVDGYSWINESFNEHQIPEMLSGQEGYDFAYAGQKLLEESIIDIFDAQLEKKALEYSNNVVISGGVGMNVVCNQLLRKSFPNLNFFVGCCPGDAGLSFGLLYKFLIEKKLIPASKRFDISYAGTSISDSWAVENFLLNCPSGYVEVDAKDVAHLLRKGKIIGIIQGRHEIGPRALGNRSIICDPSFYDMKEVLNDKVKFREFYRPFAPMCRKEDVDKFFESPTYDNLEFMSYALDVREEYREKFPSITHIDGTARVQTITKEKNPFLYDVIGYTDGLIINTSFNRQGEPILNKLDDALEILNLTELDYLVFQEEGRYLLIQDPHFGIKPEEWRIIKK